MADKSGVVIGEKPTISMDVVDGKIRLTWKTSLLKRTLDHTIDKCVGCSLCLPCPWDAITMGPVQETASGKIEGAPLVNVDPDRCTFCGLCDSSCVFGAFDASYEGENAINTYNRIEGIHEIDEEKCAPCLLCSKVCPTGSLDVEVKVDHKTDLVKYLGKESATGTIKVDEDKCSYCGLCELLCPEAIKIFWSDSAEPPDFKPAVGIRVDEDHCDYCGLCENICPSDAIKVECKESSKRTISQPTITGKLTHKNETCVKCGLCAEVCPYEALKVIKPFSGEVIVKRREKCDPTGCNNCFNICPVKAIYPTGTADKIAILDEHCIYCGACEQSCPYDVLEVHREGYHVKELENAREWEKSRREFFEAVIGNEPPPSSLFEREICVKPIQRARVPASARKEWETVDGEREGAMKIAQNLKDLFKKDSRAHLHFERGRTKKVIEKIKESQEARQEK
ncbi:MAG: 4Fe-4S binding protein [Promethearchaeota archaeon]